jgi:hypothetical protein
VFVVSVPHRLKQNLSRGVRELVTALDFCMRLIGSPVPARSSTVAAFDALNS